jgi:hypothetical protein
VPTTWYALFSLGALETVVPDANYQIASNFIADDGMNLGNGLTELERYDGVHAYIKERNGMLSEDHAVGVLTDIGIHGGNRDMQQLLLSWNGI